ncbi:MAG TPA: cytochrome c [Pyrinomonadaceae bacterium]|nr:cytochrome c [Pyrinomonadaceae bacterium]
MNKTKLIVFLIWLVVAAWAFVSCTREKREFRQAPPSVATSAITQSDLHPGSNMPPLPPTENPVEKNAYALNEGKRLYDAYNCSGCHFHGGGGIGPPLMDDKWVYGGDPANIFATIVEGRPNGMPSFRGKIPDAQVWQLAGYVRSMSGQVSKDASPSRDDHMYAKPSEQSTKQEQPKNSSLPKSAEMPQ